MAATNGARTTSPVGPVAPQGGPAGRLIGGHYAIDPSIVLPDAGGGLAAFAASRAGDPRLLMAVEAPPNAPPRPQAINTLAGVAIPGLLTPLAVGPATGAEGRNALFVVCPRPPGPALAAGHAIPWTEQELLQALLRPAAAALARLAALSVAHRAIRANNLFRAGPGEQVVLGCAWATPPALLQPAVYEPPYVAICHPSGRGEGSIADDVYALGVTMLILALGRVPLAGLDEAEIVRRKIDQGSFRALAGRERLPPMIADLVSGMLAEDPEHRPPPALLADPAAARSRRVAARPHRRAQRPLELGGHEVWHARGLAHALATDTGGGAKPLRVGAVETWLRRGLGEATLAARIEEIVRQRLIDAAGEDARADAMLTMRAVAALDPLAPLCWEGVCLWPDGIGPLLASISTADSDPVAGRMTRLIGTEAAGPWVAARPERPGAAALRLDIRQDRAKLLRPGWAGGLSRLCFTLNPLLACRSRLLGGAAVARLADLLPALEAAARPELHAQLPIDREIAAYIAARDDLRVEGLVAGLGGGGDNAVLATLRLLASLQQRLAGQPTPRLAAWLAHHLADSARSWRNRARREECVAALAAAVAAGRLDHMLALLDDEAATARGCRRCGGGGGGGATDRRRVGRHCRRVRRADRGGAAARLRSGRRARYGGIRRHGHRRNGGVMSGGRSRAGAGRGARTVSAVPWVQGLGCGAVVALAAPTALLALLLLMPAVVAAVFDPSPQRRAARPVLLWGGAASVAPMVALWTDGHTLSHALALASDLPVLARSWAAQAAGWLAAELLPLLIAAGLHAAAATRAARLRAERARHAAEWDLPTSPEQG